MVYCQDTVYVAKNGSWVKEADMWIAKYIVTKVNGDNGILYKATRYSIFAKKISEGTYVDDSLKTKEGSFVLFFENGNIKSRCDYRTGKRHGVYESYWENGKVKRNESFSHGESTGGICYDNKGKTLKYFPIEIFPHFKECSKQIGDSKKLENCFSEKLFAFLNKNLVYPHYAKENNIQGKVVVGFTINSDGSISEVEVLQGVHYQLDDAAMDVIKKLPILEPAKDDSEPVKVRYRIPINFTLR